MIRLKVVGLAHRKGTCFRCKKIVYPDDSVLLLTEDGRELLAHGNCAFVEILRRKDGKLEIGARASELFVTSL